jgi:cell division protein FtsX
MEEVDVNPRDTLRELRQKKIDEIDRDVKQQDEINRNLNGLERDGSQTSRTALTVLAILVVIGVFLVISYMTEGESADELMRVPSVKVVPAERAVPSDRL